MAIEQVIVSGEPTAPDLPELPPFNSADVAAHGADAHWRVVRDGATVARCSLWWRHAATLQGRPVGLIGHYAATDRDAGVTLLNHAWAELGARGCGIAVGPMDGSTWRRYRLVTERGGEPPFFLEPDNPDAWPGHFLAAGFSAVATYYSALCTDLGRADPRLERVTARLEAAGIAIRPIAMARFEEELAAIHALSLISFADNLLYTPISLTQFVEQYRPIASILRPELVLLAERRGELVGYVFALPDLLQAKRGRPIDTIIVKTAAILPGRELAGLGGLLVSRVHAAAANTGYTRAVHALMHESNESRNLSAHYGAPFRRYLLYGRPASERVSG